MDNIKRLTGTCLAECTMKTRNRAECRSKAANLPWRDSTRWWWCLTSNKQIASSCAVLKGIHYLASSLILMLFTSRLDKFLFCHSIRHFLSNLFLVSLLIHLSINIMFSSLPLMSNKFMSNKFPLLLSYSCNQIIFFHQVCQTFFTVTVKVHALNSCIFKN